MDSLTHEIRWLSLTRQFILFIPLLNLLEYLKSLTEIWPARPASGVLVFAFAFLDHDTIDWTWQLAGLFKVEKGNIHRIEAIYRWCPYGMNSGWSTYEQGISEIHSIR